MAPQRLMKRTLIALGLLMASLSHAHFLWVSVDPKNPQRVKIELSETPGDSAVPGIAGKADKVKGWLPGGRALKLDKTEQGFTADVSGGQVSGASLEYGVLDRNDQNRGVFLLEYFAKCASTLEAAKTKLGLKTELIAEKANGKLVLTALLNGKPASDAEYVVVLGNDDAVEAKADAKGQWSIAWPKDRFIAARVMVPENKSGEMDGQKYTLVRTYATLAVGVSPVAAGDSVAYELLRQASQSRASFPKDVLGFSADISADVAGHAVKGTFVFDHERGLDVKFTDGSDEDSKWVQGQLRSLILHRTSIPFEKGDGAYAINFTGSENALGKQVVLSDSMDSRYRIRDGQILEVDRKIGEGRLVVCVLDSILTKGGQRLSTQMSVSHFARDGKLQANEMISDQFVEVGGGVFPAVRRVLSTTDAGIITRVLTLSNVKLIQK